MSGLKRNTLILGLVLMAGAALFAPAVQAAANCPQARVAGSAGLAFLNAAKAQSAPQFAEALDSYADMRRIALFALGRHRKKVPANRMDELVGLTSRYVSTTLADFARKFRGIQINPIECRRDGTVKSRLEFGGGRSAQAVLWRFDDTKVVDVNVQDAWLAQLLRTNFDTIIKDGNGDIEALFAALRKS